MKIVLIAVAAVGYLFWLGGMANPFGGSAGGYFSGGTIALVGACLLHALDLRKEG